VGQKREGTESYIGVASVGLGVAGKGLAGVRSGGTAAVSSGDGRPAALGGEERFGELHRSKRKLAAGSVEVEEERRRELCGDNNRIPVVRNVEGNADKS
jgi:hypothetical protein